MVEVGTEHGVDVRKCLHSTGISPEMLHGEGAVVSDTQELAVAANLVTATGHAAGVGLAVGERLSLRAYGIWGFALLTCPTVLGAVEFGLHYLPLTCAVTGLSLRVCEDEAHLIVDDRRSPAALRPFLAEREVAVTAGILRTILGESPPSLRVELRRSRPSADYEKAIGAPVRFDTPHDAIVTSSAVLDLPLPQADPLTMTACERTCLSLLREQCAPCVAQAVRTVIAEGVTDAGLIAARLHLSARTLRRHLAAEGTSLRNLVDEARRVKAIELITLHHLGVEQVALRLGYAEAATFIRAFRRWTGTTPGAYTRR
ncbi:AraC family transcriptional regulator [Lentzea aerocolonigenes]|uniref:AraC family transcriptional regulator n=1 Tax=Lentzea aerocolonigenes TaxID=68170 RepID=UPI00068B79EF|nr:AraC family transcriptional regulator [Lentzea aerocolonigenes]MCP2247283.1 Helix-turn-helix domain-containing protein [Lentzea aerocolonigenes]